MEISNNMEDMGSAPYDGRSELFEKIKICVGYDLIKHKGAALLNPSYGGGTPWYDDMTTTQKIKFKKQTTRLYDACMISPESQNYINERYEDIIKKRKPHKKI